MAFHPYPRVIPPVFNRGGFGPPRGLTPASACPWVDRPASRPRPATERPVQTRLRCGSLLKLNLAADRDSLAHSTKGTPSHQEGAPTACRRTVSGTVSLPSRGAFHLSLTVLVRYRSQGSVQPWRVVPPASDRVPRVRPYSGAEKPGVLGFRVRGCYPVPRALPRRFRYPDPLQPAGAPQPPPISVPQPLVQQRLWALPLARVWAWRAFARRY